MSVVEGGNQFMEQVAVERRNLSLVCRLAVKSLIDKSCFETIDETHSEFLNFCAILENVLNHRIKTKGSSGSWISKKAEAPCFWLLIRKVCRRLHHNCITSIESMEHLSSSREKGRAWIRLALMEKKLSDYVSMAVTSTDVLRRYYQDGAFLLSEDTQKLVLDLLGLNAIDFSFDLKEVKLSSTLTPLVDYTPYLRFQQCQQSMYSDSAEYMASLEQSSNGEATDVEKIRSWKDRYDKLEKKFKAELEQKGYLEELVRLRDSQLFESNQQRQALLINLQNLEQEAQVERRQLESVVLELQSQLTSLKDEHLRLTQQIRAYIHASDHRRRNHSESPEHVVDTHMQSMGLNELEVLQPDTRSIMSNASSLSPQPPDSQSLVPLAGSLTSLSNDRPAAGQSMIRQLVAGKKIALHDIPLGVEADEGSFRPGESDSIQNEEPGDDELNRMFDVPLSGHIANSEEQIVNETDINDDFDFEGVSDDDRDENDLLVGSQCTLDSESSIALVHRNYNINPGIDVDNEHRSMTPSNDIADSKETTPIVADETKEPDFKEEQIHNGFVSVTAVEVSDQTKECEGDDSSIDVIEDDTLQKEEGNETMSSCVDESQCKEVNRSEVEENEGELNIKSMSVEEINDNANQINEAIDDVDSSDEDEFLAASEVKEDLENSNQSNHDSVDNRPSINNTSPIYTERENTSTSSVVDNMNSANVNSSLVESGLIDDNA